MVWYVNRIGGVILAFELLLKDVKRRVYQILNELARLERTGRKKRTGGSFSELYKDNEPDNKEGD